MPPLSLLVCDCEHDNSKSCWRILMISRGMGCLPGNKRFDFGADPDDDIRIQEFLAEF